MRFSRAAAFVAAVAVAACGCSPRSVPGVLEGDVALRVAPPPVPILMYHVIARPRPAAPFPGLYVTPALFRAQVRTLARLGYRAVTLQAVYDAWHGLGVLPRRPIVLSFDDGYRSQFTVAAAALRRLRWPGVLNLVVAHLRRGASGLSTAMVRRMIAWGWEIDSHTLTHPDLTTLGPAALRHEVEGSRIALRHRFHVAAAFFCYPSGRFDAAVVAAVRRAGYLGATTTQPGFASPRDGMFTLHRIRVGAGESPAELDRAVAASRRG